MNRSLRAGSLFTGAGWLTLAVEQVFGARTVWTSDIEPGPCKVLAHRFPGIPNLGDITTINWHQVAANPDMEIDLLEGGSPCTDISSAGRLLGMVPGTRSNLWVEMREAIRILQPMFVIWENVGAARSTKAASRFHPEHIDRAIAHHLAVAKGTHHAPTKQRHRKAARRLMESRARRLGSPYPKPSLRALGRVLGDLADLGFDSEFIALRAADVGAPHGRLRYFVVAANRRGQEWLAAHAPHLGHEWGREARRRGNGSTDGGDGPLTCEDCGHDAGAHRWYSRCEGTVNQPDCICERTPADCAGRGVAVQLLPTPRATDGEKGGPNQRGSSGDLMLPSAVAMLPTPRATRGGSRTETVELLPTPSVADSTGGHERRGGDRGDELLLKGIAAEQAWGPYEPAIRRWEAIVGPAPAPTKPGKKGRPKLNPEFACWLMGAEPGWVTDVPGVTDNEALRMAGNGVVQQQAVAAMTLMLDRLTEWGLR